MDEGKIYPRDRNKEGQPQCLLGKLLIEELRNFENKTISRERFPLEGMDQSWMNLSSIASNVASDAGNAGRRGRESTVQ